MEVANSLREYVNGPDDSRRNACAYCCQRDTGRATWLLYQNSADTITLHTHSLQYALGVGALNWVHFLLCKLTELVAYLKSNIHNKSKKLQKIQSSV
ncbi:unnamed protein product [Ceratitis capitata]|uniref:(Mediterranean fruit fly) hypothetical protein n=1 Tax=Ceratitis capitata TaxID=7213 RepID=A0A811U1F2_CERCA|nr:unnamed protein product [Ceratitis capitata]